MLILLHICEPYLAAGEVGVFGQFSVESLEENLICDFTNVHAGFVQHREDAFMLLLHQIHDDLVIEVVDLQPERTDTQISTSQKSHHYRSHKWIKRTKASLLREYSVSVVMKLQ